MRLTTVLAVVTASFSPIAIAQTERDLGSHEHGSAFLNIAVDDGAVFIELETPWDNLVGFEHAPGTTEQHALVDNALSLLNQPEQLFSLDGGGCTVAEVSVESSISSEEHDDEHDDEHKDGHDDEHKDEHDDDHKDEHDDEHKDGHDDDHKDDHDDEHKDGHDDEQQTHSAVLATYSFNCTDTTELSVIDVTLLDLWSGFEELDVQLIGPGGQASKELNQQQQLVDITQVQ